MYLQPTWGKRKNITTSHMQVIELINYTKSLVAEVKQFEMRYKTFSWYKSANAITPEKLAQHPWIGIRQKILCNKTENLKQIGFFHSCYYYEEKRTIKGEEWHVNINNII